MMNRFFTLLLAASCLTAVGQGDCMISEEDLWGFSIGGGSFECLGDGGIESVAYQVVLFPNGVIVQTTDDYSCEVGVWEFSPFTCSYSISGMYVYDECYEFLQCVLEGGCLDQEACNYDPEAEFHDGSCLYLDDCGVCGGQSQSGCSDANACNYCEEGECEFPSCGCDCEGDCLSGEATILFYPIGGCDLEYPPTEFYLPNVELSCLFSNGNADGDFAEGDSCQLYLNGNLVFEGIPGDYYGPQVEYGTLTQPYLTPENYPCGIDTLVFKFPRPNNDTLTLTGFWSLEYVWCGDLSYLYGCTDIEAVNFSSDFLCDDGSCIYLGCTDPMSCNFDVTANSDDGSCDYSCCPGPGCCHEGTIWDADLQQCIVANPADINLDGCVQLNDLLDLLGAYGDCGAEESPWQCGDPLEYQGYDYETVQIGEQCWFAENVRYLPGVSPPSIGSEQDGLPHAYVYGWYSEDGDIDAAMSTPNYNSFGALYNFQAVTDWDLCPSGWHVPSAAEFRTLDVALGLPDEELNNIGWTGASAEIGTALKVESGWCCGGGGTNTSGFSAKGAGGRWGDGPAPFADIGLASRWWTSTGSGGNAWHHDVASQNPGVYWKDDAPKSRGHSVRCVKDTE